MLTLPPSVRIFFATSPVDFRKGVDGLVGLVQRTLQQDPMSGHSLPDGFPTRGGCAPSQGAHNGEVERRLRRVTMGRDAYLFAGSDEGARRAATAYTVIVSARMHGHDALFYLVDVMNQLQSGWPISRIDELLRDRWTQQAAEERKAQQTPRGTFAL